MLKATSRIKGGVVFQTLLLLPSPSEVGPWLPGRAPFCQLGVLSKNFSKSMASVLGLKHIVSHDFHILWVYVGSP